MLTRIGLFLLVCRATQAAWDWETSPDRRCDLGFALDRHHSIDEVQWNETLLFVANFSALIDIDNGFGQVGLVSFDEISTLDIELNKHDDTISLQQDILSQIHSGYGRDISLGIYRLREDLFTVDKGDSNAFGNVAILITNGISDFDWASREAELLRNKGATLIAIGVGGGVSVDLLNKIAGGEQNVLQVPAFNQLSTITNQLLNLVTKAVVPQLYCALDICVAVEGVTEWPETQDYLIGLAWLADIETSNDGYQTRFGVVVFTDTGNVSIRLDAHSSYANLSEAINTSSPPTPGTADLANGLQALQDCFATGQRPNVHNVAILITKSQSNATAAMIEAANLQSMTKVITLSIGNGVNFDLMHSMQTSGTFNVTDYTELAANPDLTLPSMCPNPPFTTPTPSTTTTKPYQTRPPTVMPTDPKPQPPDGFRVDMGYAIDRHQSIDRHDWAYMLEFLSVFSSFIGIEQTGNRIGLVSFDEISTLDIQLDKHTTIAGLQNETLNQRYSGWGRDISLGIYRLHADLYTNEKGDRSDIQNIAILITNGDSDYDWAVQEAEQYKKKGGYLLAIGVGDGVNDNLLTAITGSPKDVFHTESFQTLSEVIYDVLERVYNVGYQPGNDVTTDNTLTIILCCTIIPTFLIIIIGVGVGVRNKNKKHKSESKQDLPNHQTKSLSVASLKKVKPEMTDGEITKQQLRAPSAGNTNKIKPDVERGTLTPVN